MNRAFLRAFAVSLMLYSGVWAAGPQVAADAYTSASSPAQNFGGLTNLLVGQGNTSWVRFDLSSYVSITGADVSHAYIAGYARTVTTGGTINICDANGAWSESTITQNTAPATPICTAGYTFSPSVANQWLVTEVTGLV